jgi:hypothetical protein
VDPSERVGTNQADSTESRGERRNVHGRTQKWLVFKRLSVAGFARSVTSYKNKRTYIERMLLERGNSGEPIDRYLAATEY